MSDIGDNGHLRSFIDRILRLKEEQDALGADIRDIYAEAKGNGFDKAALGQVVSYLRKKDKDAAKLEEQTAIFDLYLAAYEGPSRTHAHARARVAPNEPGAATEVAGDYLREPVAVEQGQIIREGDAPRETDRSSGVASSPDTEQQVGANVHISTAARNDAGKQGVTAGETAHSEVAQAEAAGQGSAPVLVSNPALATIPDEDIPAFLRKSAEPEINERCERPKDCKFSHHQNKVTCATCSTAWAIAHRKREVAA